MVPSVVSVYDVTINTNSGKRIIKRAELAHEAKRSDRALYDAAKTGCVNFIMSIVYKKWYKELEYADTFDTNVTAKHFSSYTSRTTAPGYMPLMPWTSHLSCRHFVPRPKVYHSTLTEWKPHRRNLCALCSQ